MPWSRPRSGSGSDPEPRHFYTFFTAIVGTLIVEQPSRRLAVVVLTGLTAIVVVALFVYLVIAMVRAEDL